MSNHEVALNPWAELLEKSPFIAIIIALGIATIYLFRSREKDRTEHTNAMQSLQTKYMEDLVSATKSLQDLTSESLKQAFADSSGWQERLRSMEQTIKDSAVSIKAHVDLAIDRLDRKS